MKRSFAPMLTAAFAAVSLGTASAALAAGAAKEISTASEHSGYAANAEKLKVVHTHMHHVLNCMVGENGDGFDASVGNPCKGQGAGALNDLGSDMSGAQGSLKRVAELMRTGVQVEELEPAQQIAQAAQGILEEVEAE